VGLGVVVFLGPLVELAVERLEAGEVELATEELVAHGAEEALDLALGGAVAHGRVEEQAADAGADLDQLLAGVDRTVVHVEGFGDAALVEGGAKGGDERIHVFMTEELAVAAHARGVVHEGDEAGLDLGVGARAAGDVGAVEGVGLPELVGVGLGEGLAVAALAVAFGFEQLEAFDEAGEGGGRDLGAVEQALFDAEAVEGGAGGSLAVGLGEDGAEGLEELFGGDLAGLGLVGAGGVGQGGGAVFFVAEQPGFDGAPGDGARSAEMVTPEAWPRSEAQG
jgi:hypothetical protein